MAGAAVVAAAVAVLAAGCGTGGPAFGGDLSSGKQLFVGKCGSCHVMADAGTRGVIGPNLDHAFGPAFEQGFEASGVQQAVLDQIRLAEPPMPRNLVTGDDAADVSAYVAACAGKKCNVTGSTPAGGGEAAGGSGAGGGQSGTAGGQSGTAGGQSGTGGGEAAGAGGEGQALFSSLGCQSCHTLDGTKSVGPTLQGVSGSTVALAGGKKVEADQMYLLESILDPDKQIVRGYSPGVMSAAIKPGSVARADAQALVSFIEQQK